MASQDNPPLTELIDAASAGNREAMSVLWDQIYTQVHQMSTNRIKWESDKIHLQATQLAHEAYLRVYPSFDGSFKNRKMLFGALSLAMERSLVDYARSRSRKKRGGGSQRIAFEIAEGSLASECDDWYSDDLDRIFELLDELAGEPETQRASEVVRLRFVLGLSVEQAAEILEVSERTVKSDWRFARAWLASQLEAEDQPRKGQVAQ